MDRSGDRLNLVSIAFAAIVTILFQLVSTRILSFIYWNHLVYLTITIALLGFGISGSLLAVFHDRPLARPGRTYSALFFGLGTTMAASLLATSATAELPTSVPVWLKLGISYLIFVVPFVFAGAIISLILSNATGTRVGRLYGVDLACSGLVCAGFAVALPLLGAPAMVLLLAGGSFLLAAVWVKADGAGTEPPARRRSGYLFGGAMLVLGLAAALSPRLIDFDPEPYKELGHALRASEAIEIEETTWTSITRIDVSGRADGGPMSPYYSDHPEGSYKIITQDGTAHTRLLSQEAIEALEADVASGRESHPSNLPYHLKTGPDVGIIGVGGGIDVAAALAYGARSVTGLELNPATARYAAETYRDYTGGLLDDPRVDLVVSEGRSFLRRNAQPFDLLQIIAIDTFAALSSGAYVLSENYLYTVEAFRDFYRQLKPDGVLTFYRFLFHPPRETLRLTTIAAEAWAAEGNPDFAASLFVFTNHNRRWALALFKRSPFGVEEANDLVREAARRGMSVLYFPKVLEPEAQAAAEARYYARQDAQIQSTAAAFNAALGAYAEGRPETFLADYAYNVAPTTDDSPFFFEYNHLGAIGLPALDRLRGDGASTTLLIILVEAVVLSVLAILGPLAMFRRSGLAVPQAGSFTGYFMALGLGFMLVEIALIQKAVLFLGDPMHALTVILATILVGAGIGSLIQGRLGALTPRLVPVFALVLVGLLGAMALGLTPLFRDQIALPYEARVAVIVGLLALPSLLMGTLMPAGLERLRDGRAGFIPWAWGINGCTSVLGSVIAILLALVHGFSVALAAGAACYLVAFVLALRIFRSPQPAT